MSYAADRDSSIGGRCPESTCARSKGVEMSKRSKRMPKLMTLRVGCAELLQAARSHPGCSPHSLTRLESSA